MFRQRLPVCAFAFFSEASLLSMDLLRLLIEAWKRMASGNAIDEQYRDVWAMHEAAYNARREERDVADRDGPSSDQAQAENYDPNDVIVPQNASGQGRFAVVPGTLGPPMDDSDDEDVYDY